MSGYLGDFRTGQTVRAAFNTNNVSAVPTSLAGGTLQLEKDGTNVTPSGGMTLNTDVNSVTGRNTISVDLSADATTFSAGSDFKIYLSAGTVNSVSVVGDYVAEWSISNRGILIQSGVIQAGSTVSSVVLQGTSLQAVTGAYNGQRLRDDTTGESRTINTHTYAAPNHTFAMVTPFVTTVPVTGSTMKILPN